MARRHPAKSKTTAPAAVTNPLRIIGGRLRGRKLLYDGRHGTRPMKDRVREALFNLVGPSVKGQHAIDLFAGTGALGLEALSRGAASATFIEQHFPTANLVEQNIQLLELGDVCDVAREYVPLGTGFDEPARSSVAGALLATVQLLSGKSRSDACPH